MGWWARYTVWVCRRSGRITRSHPARCDRGTSGHRRHDRLGPVPPRSYHQTKAALVTDTKHRPPTCPPAHGKTRFMISVISRSRCCTDGLLTRARFDTASRETPRVLANSFCEIRSDWDKRCGSMTTPAATSLRKLIVIAANSDPDHGQDKRQPTRSQADSTKSRGRRSMDDTSLPPSSPTSGRGCDRPIIEKAIRPLPR